jgi:NUMOD3 motif
MAMTPEERLYFARHRRNEAQRGKAKLLKCVDCAAAGIDKYARDWSHRHGTDPDNVMNYDPRCRKCHIAYDPTAGHHKPHSEETKALLSQKNTGYVHTPEAVEKIRATSAGRKHAPESIAKMSAQQKAAAEARGPMPEEQRAKISASLRKNGDGKPGARARRDPSAPPRPVGNPNLGKTRAAQQRAKTHCDQNHELTPDNIYWRGPDKKNRQCKRCARERSAARYQAQKEAARRKAA